MPVDHERRIVFLHPRKTGGSSVADALGFEPSDETSEKHATFWEIYDQIGAEAWDTYTIISTIRNPLDTIVSDYYFNRKLYERGNHDKLRTFCNENDVNAFVTDRVQFAFRVLQDENGELAITEDGALFSEKRGKLKVDFWLRTEHLAEDLDAMLNATGLELKKPLTVINKSQNPGRDELSPTSRAAIFEHCRPVFMAFYKSDLPAISYFERDKDVIAYPQMSVPGLKMRLRGVFDEEAFNSGNYFTALGAAQTMGRFVEKPYCEILSEQFGLWGMNLGRGAAGAGNFAGDGVVSTINRGKFCIVQVMSGRSTKNVFFNPRTGRNVFGIEKAQPGVSGFTEQVLSHVLKQNDPEFLDLFLQQVRAAWVKENERLAARITVPTVFLWFADREPAYQATLSKGIRGISESFPQMIDDTALEAASQAFDYTAICTSQRGRPHRILKDGKPVMIQIGTKILDHNHYYPSPEMHEDAAAAIAPAIEKILTSQKAAVDA